MELTNLSIKKSFLMNSIDFESLLIIIFVLVDDWYEDKGKTLKGKLPGVKPEMSDSEIMTLAIMMDYLPFPGETQFLGFIRANYGQWFPNRLVRSQFNRRLRKLGQMLEILRREWVKQLGGLDAVSLIIDTKPIPVLGYRRSKRCSDFEGSADYGYCAASTDERLAVEGVLQFAYGCDVYGDKEFIGQDWQAQITDATGNHIWTRQRSNQARQVSSTLKRLIGRVRQRIEGVFHEIQNTGRNPERLLNKTVQGFMTHMAAKITAHTLRLLLRRQFAIDVLTFQSLSLLEFNSHQTYYLISESDRRKIREGLLWCNPTQVT